MSEKVTLGTYTIELSLDIALGIATGIFIEFMSTTIALKFGMNFTSRMIMQIFFIILALSISKKFHIINGSAWMGDCSYGVLFIAALLASQYNLQVMFDEIRKNLHLRAINNK